MLIETATRNRSFVFACFVCLACLVAGASPTESVAQETRLRALDAREPITYFIAEGIPGSAFRLADRELAQWALEAWERAAKGALTLEPGTEETALLRIYFVPATAGQYGEMRPILVDGQRGAMVFVRPDTDALGADIAQAARLDNLLRETIVYLTCLHEIGHALGLEHTAEHADVMYFFGYGGDIPLFFSRYRDQLRTRSDISGVSGLSEGDIAQLYALYGIVSASTAQEPPDYSRRVWSGFSGRQPKG